MHAFLVSTEQDTTVDSGTIELLQNRNIRGRRPHRGADFQSAYVSKILYIEKKESVPLGGVEQ